MDARLYKQYFQKGFDDFLEKQAEQQNLEKQAFVDNPDILAKFTDKITEGVANALVRSSFQAVGSGAKGIIRAAVGDKLPRRHKEFITKLIMRDPVLKNRPKEKVISHYKTMVRVAPSISLDPNVVVSFLKESTSYDTISTVTIKTLLDLEKTMLDNQGKTSNKYGNMIGMK